MNNTNLDGVTPPLIETIWDLARPKKGDVHQNGPVNVVETQFGP